MTPNADYVRHPHWLDGHGDCRYCGQWEPQEGSECPAFGGPVTPNADLVAQFRWLVENSDGVIGLRLDGGMMPWPEVVALYLPDYQASPTGSSGAPMMPTRGETTRPDRGGPG